MGDAVTLGDAAATRAIQADRVHLVEIGHRAVTLGDIAQRGDRCDIAVHRINRLEADELWPLRRQVGEQAGEVVGIVVAEDQPLGPAVADAGDHRGVVHCVRQHDHSGHAAGQCRQRRLVRHIAGGEDQRRRAAVQICELAFEQHMGVAGSRDIAGAARAGARSAQFLRHGRQHGRVLPHAEIIVRAPHRDLGADAVIESAREAAAAPLEIGKDPVAALGVERVDARPEKTVEIHNRCYR